MKEQEYIDKRKKQRKKKLQPLDTSKSLESSTVKRGNAYQFTKTGFRSDLGIIARSNWEANIIRILETHRIAWEFEPRTFHYPIKRGVKGYIPDIYLTDTKEYIEVKGWMDPRSKTKLKRFKKYYPDEFSRLTLIIGKSSPDALTFCKEIGVPTILFYQNFLQLYKDSIPNWEGK